jgi:hypothetical protein
MSMEREQRRSKEEIKRLVRDAKTLVEKEGLTIESACAKVGIYTKSYYAHRNSVKVHYTKSKPQTHLPLFAGAIDFPAPSVEVKQKNLSDELVERLKEENQRLKDFIINKFITA